jgi:hypothetical protein
MALNLNGMFCFLDDAKEKREALFCLRWVHTGCLVCTTVKNILSSCKEYEVDQEERRFEKEI